MKELFLVAVKSTLDKLGNDLALSQVTPTKFVDLDDATAVEAVLTSTEDAILWELSSFDVAPVDPLYRVEFNIGARTTNDPANYNILKLAGKVREVFQIGSKIEIRDYSGDTASSPLGFLFVTFIAVNPQVYDRVSGIRMISVSAKAQRYV